MTLHVFADHAGDNEAACGVGPIHRTIGAHDDIIWAVEFFALPVRCDGGVRAVMLDAPDRPLRPTGDHQSSVQIKSHTVGVARGMHQNRFSDARKPLVDSVADNIDPEKAPLAAVPNRALTEICSVSNLIERWIGTHDTLKSLRNAVDVH